MTPHMKRWITGIIAIPILFGIIAYGGKEAFAVLIIVASLAGMQEYNRMAFGQGLSLEMMETLIIALLILLTSFYANLPLLLAVLTFAVMTVLILNLLRIRKQGLDMSHAGRVILGILYIPLLMAHFILIRQTQSGVLWIFFILYHRRRKTVKQHGKHFMIERQRTLRIPFSAALSRTVRSVCLMQ